MLSVVLLAAIATLLSLTATPSLALTTILFMLCFAALGAGNGALFQLVPLRWPNNTAVAGSMIGEIGALGGAILPNVMGLSKQYTGSFSIGFIGYAAFTAVVLGCLASGSGSGSEAGSGLAARPWAQRPKPNRTSCSPSRPDSPRRERDHPERGPGRPPFSVGATGSIARRIQVGGCVLPRDAFE